jgi:hypothetical protein
MIKKLHRIIELQLGDSYATRATDTAEESKLLDEILENTKPFIQKNKFDRLIYTSFRYDLPVPEIYAARFKPAGFKYNVWYGTYETETAIYEATYHFMRERIHLKCETGSVESRTLVKAEFNVENFLDISKRKNLNKIMNKKNYIESYLVSEEAVKKNRDGIIYPSCRDPKKGKCAAAYKIDVFSEDLNKLSELTLDLFYKDKKIQWTRGSSLNLTVDWNEVS